MAGLFVSALRGVQRTRIVTGRQIAADARARRAPYGTIVPDMISGPVSE